MGYFYKSLCKPYSLKSMKTEQYHYINDSWKHVDSSTALPDRSKCQLVFVFGAPQIISQPTVFNFVKEQYPSADIVFSSTSGEIMNDEVFDDSAVVTAIEFNKTVVKSVVTDIKQHNGSFESGLFLLKQLQGPDLKLVFVISDGTHVNGSELVSGLNENNINNVIITGGLAGDAARFSKTFTGLNEVPTEGKLIALGFYGDDIEIGHGSSGGWDEFGHERTITKSDKNVLHEIDGKNALDLYKQYLGDYVSELPGSALLFPLSIRINGSQENLVRTILSIDENEKSMTFAGNLPEGSKVRLMKANFDKLIDAASTAADFSSVEKKSPSLAILVSCVGRKLVLQERSDEEIVAAKEMLGGNTCITGFYSYGEISPFKTGTNCELHNQTMTITTITEN